MPGSIQDAGHFGAWRRRRAFGIAGELCPRAANRANSEAVIAEAGMALAIASSRVHRPSLESSAYAGIKPYSASVHHFGGVAGADSTNVDETAIRPMCMVELFPKNDPFG